MQINWQVFWLQKAGSSKEEYEDAFSPKDLVRQPKEAFRCSVADGATETSFSGLWAQMLADSYVQKGPSLAEMQQAWQNQISGKELAWYAEEKAESGAFAAYVGLTLYRKSGKHGSSRAWEAKALGDSCLFQIRKGEIIVAMPLESWHQFSSSPALISSNPARNKGIEENLVEASGNWRDGDIFYLMSDAISCWFLRRQEEHGDAIDWMEAISDQTQFESLVSEQREIADEDGRRMMRNDDVTLMRICPEYD